MVKDERDVEGKGGPMIMICRKKEGNMEGRRKDDEEDLREKEGDGMEGRREY